MTFKRRVLSALGRDELLEIGRGLELDVTTRMGVEELRDAFAKSKRANLDAIVQESLSRHTLKAICGAVGLDHTGKEKAALVERILAVSGDKAANGAGYRIDPTAVRGSKAAADAYGMPPVSSPVELLRERNQLVAEDEEPGRTVRGPGLPDHLDPKDPRWFSADSSEPSPVGP